MRRLPHAVAALLLAAVSVPAQWSIEARFGRPVRPAAPAGPAVRVVDGSPRHRGPCPPARRLFDDCRTLPRGHWQTVSEQFLVPGFWRDEHVPPTYGWVVDCWGRRCWAMVDPGGCRQVWVPARWELRTRQVWVNC
jgi:hypothetical protein